MMSTESHRCGAMRVTSDLPVVGPVEVAMRANVPENFYIKTYELSDESDDEEQSRGWKDAFASTTKRALERLKSSRYEDDEAEPTPANKAAVYPIPTDRIQPERSSADPIPTNRIQPDRPAAEPILKNRAQDSTIWTNRIEADPTPTDPI